ncbi:hypothetical protein [Streptomyces sp. NPDC055189]
MLNSTDAFAGFAHSFEHCQRLRRLARETIDRARKMRSEAVEMRLQAAQIRADRARWLSARLTEGLANRPAPTGTRPSGTHPTATHSPGTYPTGTRPPATRPSGKASPAVQLAALAAFVHARLDEEAASADLFHKADCPAAEQTRTTDLDRTRCPCRIPHRTGPPARCGCPTPRLIHQKIDDRRNIAHNSEAVIRQADHTAPNWPHNELNALQDLQTLAVSYELHWLWQEEWRP